MIPVNKTALIERVNEGEAILQQTIDNLSESLSQYGFKGRIKLSLEIGITDKTWNIPNSTIITRSSEIHFKR